MNPTYMPLLRHKSLQQCELRGRNEESNIAVCAAQSYTSLALKRRRFALMLRASAGGCDGALTHNAKHAVQTC